MMIVKADKNDLQHIFDLQYLAYQSQASLVGDLSIPKGIGTQLLSAIKRERPSERYELFTSNKSVRNIRLYERRGYNLKSLEIKEATKKEIIC